MSHTILNTLTGSKAINPIYTATDILLLHPLRPPLHLIPKSNNPKKALITLHGHPPLSSSKWKIKMSAADHAASAAAMAEIDMVRNSEGVFTARPKKVVVLWDLDNKPPRGPPYQAAMALRQVAQRFGDVVDISAYANRHAFIHLPQWVLEERRGRRRMDVFERKGLLVPDEPYVCGVCGRKCRTNLDLKKHFKQLHERERQKKLARMRSLKGKKRQRYKERYVSGNTKYEEAARELLSPKVGYGLAAELRRAGVFVKTVEDKPQAADSALKRQMQHSMSRGIDWLFLVSDDSDFSEMLRRARDSDLKTVVVGDGPRALSRHADIWVPWFGVENGEVGDEVLLSRRSDGFSEREESLFSMAHFDECDDDDDDDDEEDDSDSDVDRVIDKIVIRNTQFEGIGVSAFSEEEWVEEKFDEVDSRRGPRGVHTQIPGSSIAEDDLFWDSEEEKREGKDGYF